MIELRKLSVEDGRKIFPIMNLFVYFADFCAMMKVRFYIAEGHLLDVLSEIAER